MGVCGCVWGGGGEVKNGLKSELNYSRSAHISSLFSS